MNSKGHLFLSLLKSVLRILGSFLAVTGKSFRVGFTMYGLAELLGIGEELVDKR